MGIFAKIKEALKRTKDVIAYRLGKLFTGGVLNDEFYDELESILLSADIGSEGALNIALDHARVARDQVYDLEVKQEYDDGRLEYEVEFKAGGWEYEYTILAADGTILDYERDD